MWTAVSTRRVDNRHPITNNKQLALTNTTDKQTKHPTIDKGKNILREIRENRLILPILRKSPLLVYSFCILQKNKKYNILFIGPNVEANNNRTTTPLHFSRE
jgi:hypothetical protein